MSRTGITNVLVNNPSAHETARGIFEASDQFSMFEIWNDVDDNHETTYQLISPNGEIIDLTFTTNDPTAFNNWCINEGLSPEKIHAIAKEGSKSSYKEWFVKIIDTPVVIPEEEPEPVIEEKPKKPRRKRRTKAQIAVDKAKAEAEKTTKPKRKRKVSVKKVAAAKPLPIPEVEPEDSTLGNHRVPPRALKKEKSVWQDAEEISTPVNRKQRRAAKKRKRR